MPLGLGKWIGCSSGHNETGFQIWKKRCTGLLEFCRHPCRPLDAALNKPTPFLCWCELQGASFKRGYQLIYYSVRRVERHLIQEIETIRLPVFDKKSVGNAKVEVFPIIHPHRILNYLFDTVGVEVDPCDVHSYWDHARAMQEPWACCSPASRDHMPLGLHGDAARLWTQVRVEKMVGIFVNLPLFRPKSVRHSRWLVFSIGRDKLIKNRTFNVVWERLVWSLNWAFEGVHPRSGPGGRPLTGADLARAGMPLCRSNMRFSVTELRGDWEFHRDVWRFTASWQGQQVCYRCAAGTKGDEAYLYYNGGQTSRWLHEEFSLEQFLARRLKDRQLCTSNGLGLMYMILYFFCALKWYHIDRWNISNPHMLMTKVGGTHVWSNESSRFEYLAVPIIINYVFHGEPNILSILLQWVLKVF